MTQVSAREVAFLALDNYFLHGVFIEEGLNRFKKELSSRDFSFAYEVASGVVRRKNALDAIAKKHAAIPKKRAEKILLRMCLYQALFLDRIPDFAIGDEMVHLAKKYASQTYAKFLNAFMRNQAPKCSLDMVTPHERLSYPEYFIEGMVASYGKEKAMEILELGNAKTPLFVRDRKEMTMLPVEGKSLDEYIQSSRYYIQNPTQFAIYSHLKNALVVPPKRVLDLAASPGGKTILLHDFFPEAAFFANDVSDKKVEQLTANIRKYKVPATVSTGNALDFVSDEPFDLIIVDAPCSNSGCLYKCPEARWRLTQADIAASVELQRKLLEKAISLALPDTVIFYSTCSILPEENEQLVASFSGLNKIAEVSVLPNKEGFEGGYGALLACVTSC